MEQFFEPESLYRHRQRFFREEFCYAKWVTFEEYVKLLFTPETPVMSGSDKPWEKHLTLDGYMPGLYIISGI